MKRLFLSGMAICALLTSCYSEIDFGELMPEPRPVVNAIASPDTVVIATSISRTYSIDENVDDLFIKNADVLLTVNGSHHEQMTMVEYNDTTDRYEPQQVVAYVSTYRPQPGDRIEITASTPLGEARCSDVVPHPVEITSVETTLTLNSDGSIVWDDDGSYIATTYDATYHVQFHDPAGMDNYYLVNVSSDYYLYSSGIYIDYIDPLFEMQNQDITNIGSDNLLRNGWGWTFSDDGIDVMDYSLSLREEGMPLGNQESQPQLRHRRIRLYSISENYYKYLRSLLKDEQRDESALGDIGILEPVTIFSNIEGGTGIFGSACVSECEFYINREEVGNE